MPPSTPQHAPETNPDHMLPPHQRASSGPLVGIVIIVILLMAGALYFWGAQLNKQAQQPAYIPSGTTTIQVTTTNSQ